MSRMLTHDEFIKKTVGNENLKTIEFIASYTNAKTKLHCKCKICGYEWFPLPNNFLKSEGCVQCHGVTNAKKTHERYVVELREINPNILVIEKYNGTHTKILHRCSVCGQEWNASPGNLLRGNNCHECKKEKLKDRLKKSHNEFICEMSVLNPSIEILEKYIGANIKIKCRCKIDGHTWSVRPSHLLGGSGCPKCARNKVGSLKMIDEHLIMNKIMSLSSDIMVVGEYTGVNKKIKLRCKICNNVWYARTSHILDGGGCPQCATAKKRKTNEQFLLDLKTITNDIKPLEEYKTRGEKIKVMCLNKNCGNIWRCTPRSLLSGVGCPKCSCSKGESRILKWLQDYRINYIHQKSYKGLTGFGGRLLSYDFYLPDFNMLIEYQGEFHDGTAKIMSDEDFKIRQEYDNRKRNYAENHNVNLLEIWYWDFENINTILSDSLSSTNKCTE